MALNSVNRLDSNISQESADSSALRPQYVTASSINSQGLDETFDSEDESVEGDDEYFDDDSSSNVAARIPFASVHKEDLAFTSAKRKCFQPGQRINVKVTDIEIPDTSRLINPNVYVVELKHGDYEWVIKRRYKHFRQLHEQLVLFRARIKIPYPTKRHQERRKSLAARKQRLPHFPKTPDPLVEDLEKRKENLQSYLQGVLRSPLFRNHPDTLRFLEVSHLSFVNQLGGKWREGMVRKRSGGHKFSMGPLKNIKGCVGNCRLCQVWKLRWMILKDTYLMYVNPETGALRDVILMDYHFKVKHGKEDTKIRHGLVITNLNRKLTLRCWTSRKASEWWHAIDTAASGYAKDFTQENRFGSFAPFRKDTPVKWFVDAATYMSGVADALETAKEEIFITDWWLSPEVFMKRPIKDEGGKWRLDMILKRRAEAGVRVFIMLYKEMQVALGINSFYTKQVLQELHPNIKVMRHPDGIALWSHHEKCVVIDQRVAFLGGIDLCYGRWDTPAHRLIDLGSLGEYRAAQDVHESTERSGNLSMFTEETQKFHTEPSQRNHPSGDVAVLQVHSSPESPPFESPNTFRPKNIRFAQSGNVTSASVRAIDHSDVEGQGHGDHVTFALPGHSSVIDSAAVDVQLTDSAKVRRRRMFQRDDRSLSGSGSDSDASLTDPEADPGLDLEAESNIFVQRKSEHSHSEKQRQAHTAQYTRSVSLPHDTHFHKYKEKKHSAAKATSKTKSRHKRVQEDFDTVDHPSIARQLSTIEDEPNEENDEHNIRDGPVDSEQVALESVEKGDSMVQPAVKSSHSTQLPSIAFSDHSGVARQSPEDQPELKRKGKNRKLPKVPKHVEVIQFASPYEDCETVDTREQFKCDDHRVGSINKAFDDCEPSDAKDQIIYDPHTSSYENRSEEVKDSHLEATGSLRIDRNSNIEETTDDSAEPLAFRNYLKVITEAGNTPEVANNGHTGVSVKEEEYIASQEKARRKAERRAPNAAFKKKLNKMKTVDKDSDSDSDDEKRSRPEKHKIAKLQRQATTDVTDGFVISPAPVVLDPSKLKTRERRPLVSFLSVDKPTTPKSKRKEFPKPKKEQKVKNTPKSSKLAADLRSAFKSNRSKSVGVNVDTHIDQIDFQAYRSLTKETADERINKLTEDETYKLWIGKDYTNFIFKDFVDLDKPFDDFIDRTVTPRMPWHDIGATVYGRGARDVARHFIQRWNFTKISKRKDNKNYPLLLPKAYRHVPIPPAAINDPSVIWANSQILRSSSHWSAGIKYTENSIMNAYCDMIARSEHFIYIENQFFVSIMGHDVVENKIAEALYDRILKAYRARQDFRVIVVLPLLPAFEGELGTSRGAAIQAVTHWNYSSICRGGKSLLERLMASDVPDPFEYISFYGLRNYGELNNTLISELVYVHCKMMIVDDCKTIIGSANINDRSMIGKRDSELAIIVEDTQFVNGVFGGKPARVGKFSHSLRMSLFREHLGINPKDEIQADISDPVIKSFYKNVWMKQAAMNTTIYDKVFKCLPCDDVRSFQELKEYQRKEGLAKTDPETARQMLELKVRGHLVVMPLQFLCKEQSLAPATGTKESLAPTVIWT